MIDEQALREFANTLISEPVSRSIEEIECAGEFILTLLDELATLRSERTAAVKQARIDALEESAAICKAKAVHMESEAQAALADGEEEEEITSLRSSAWLLSVCASSIESLKGKTP